jgi:hypothetical protein
MLLSQKELALYLQCLNEVLRGFSVEDFLGTLHASQSELAIEDQRLREIELAATSGSPLPDVQVRTAVIKATMKELGESEFETRTGFQLREARFLLQKAEQLL